LKITDLPEGSILGLDTVTLIYFLEKHPTWFSLVRELFQAIENNRFSAVISTLVFAELLVPAYRAGKPEEASKLQHILSHFPNLEIAPLTPTISAEAARLRARYALRTPDAIHLATAIDSGVRGFITNDNDLQRLQAELPVWILGGNESD
jgi:predicted nucleic acid-binding protein